MEVEAGKAKWHHVVRVRRRRAAVVYRARRDGVLVAMQCRLDGRRVVLGR